MPREDEKNNNNSISLIKFITVYRYVHITLWQVANDKIEPVFVPSHFSRDQHHNK